MGSHQLIGTMHLRLLQGSWLIDFSGDFTRRHVHPKDDGAPKVNDWYCAALVLFSPPLSPSHFVTHHRVAEYAWCVDQRHIGGVEKD